MVFRCVVCAKKEGVSRSEVVGMLFVDLSVCVFFIAETTFVRGVC